MKINVIGAILTFGAFCIKLNNDDIQMAVIFLVLFAFNFLGIFINDD